jgi:ABC-type branched-subunit amino acid transport system substrate-binding protein
MPVNPARASWLAVVLLVAACGEQAPVPAGIDAGRKTITVGLLVDRSGPVASIGRPWLAGMRVLAREVNAGGSGYLPEGWRIELLERDHGYDPARAVEAFHEIRDHVLYIGTSFGTPNTLPLRPLLARHRVVAFPASLSAQMGQFEYTPPIGPPYGLEVMRAVDFAGQQAGGPAGVRLGLVYQEDDYGTEAREAARAAATRLGVTLAAEKAYTPGQADYSDVVQALQEAGVTHVMLATVPSATSPILAVASARAYRPVWIGGSPSWTDRFFDNRIVPPAIFENFHWLSPFTFWGEKVPVMGRFLAAYEKFGREDAPPDHYVLVAYVVGMVQMQVLTRMIESGDLSRAGFLAALRGLKEYDTMGATPRPLDYTTFPYVAGTQIRVLKPDIARRSWTVAAPFAEPSTLAPRPAPP